MFSKLPTIRIPFFFSHANRKYASASPQSSRVRRLLKKRITHPPALEQLKQCISASRCQKYDLKIVAEILQSQKLQHKLVGGGEALWTPLAQNRDVFVLANGTVVAWDADECSVVQRLVPLLRSAEVESFANVETEDMDFVEETSSVTQSGMIGDVIYVHGPSAQSRLSDKLAFSNGMARHTKLSAIEVATESIIQQVKVISSNMASGNMPGLSVRQVDMLTGRLLQERGGLNLYSSITETPDIYWSQPEQENLYELISKSLDVEPRIAILNKKLDYAADMVSILRDHMSERAALRVEWLIVFLILIEVTIEVKRSVLPYFLSEVEEPNSQGVSRQGSTITR